MIRSFVRRFGPSFAYGAIAAGSVFIVWQWTSLMSAFRSFLAAKPTPVLTALGGPSNGERLVWGPPMTVVIKGEAWTVRTVMEEATR